MRSSYDDPKYAGIVAKLKIRLAELQKQYQVPDDSGSVPADPPSLHKDAGQKKPKPARTRKKAA